MATPRYGRRRERGPLVALSRLLNEVRDPTTLRAKIIVGILAVLVFSSLGLVAVGGFFLSRALMPSQAGESEDPTRFLGNAQPVEFEGPDGKMRSGWFFPGLRGAPAVVICHGYGSNRTDALTLATSLQQHRYNVFAFNLAGHGESPVGYTTMGYRETEEVRAALEMLATRTDIDTARMGIWGYSLGGYAALRAAAEFPAVKALILDSLYAQPTDLLQMELGRLGAGSLPLLSSIATLEFHVVSVNYSGETGAPEALQRLAGTPKLFIAGDDAPELATQTQTLFQQAPGRKEFRRLPRTNMRSLIEEERRNYENLVVTFFLQNLPLAAAPSA